MQRVHGFTLIELMIVVAIVGLLSSIALPQYRDYVSKAKVSEMFSQMDVVKTALQEEFAQRGEMPLDNSNAAIAAIETGLLAGTKYISSATYSYGTDLTSSIAIVLNNVDATANNGTATFNFEGSGATFIMTCTSGDIPQKYFNADVCSGIP